ncbi:MAG: nucleoside-diphosphate sugar epimerase/dehydratase [Opitutaceae bacterium]|nr:nucleoside-diphosphate sugar epimerase/dehydratase [Opitutaceae bacterium]
MSNGSNNASGRPFAARNGSKPPFAATTSLSRPPFGDTSGFTRVLLLGIAYSGVIVAAHWLAYLIRFEFHPPISQQTHFWRTLQWLLPIELLSLLLFGQFRSLLSYFSLPDARRIVLACGAASLASLAVWHVTGGAHAPPRSILLLGFILDTFGLIGIRLAFRMLREQQRGNGKTGRASRRIVIVGAGDVGANLAKEMTLRRDLCMQPVAFFDDDRTKWNTRVHGVAVLGQPELLASRKLRVDEAIIAMPSASGRRVREVVQVLNEARIRFETVPSLEQMVNGAVKVSQIRPVEIEDLLGREPVSLCTDKISELIKDKVVMVTGAGGSIGSELCRQIAGYHPLRLLLVERCEVQIFPIEQELLGLGCGAQIVPLVADVLDDERMRGIFAWFRPQLVFHAAAHKHVPMMESQPYEAFRNNTIGTKHLARLAAEFGVERFVFISTDKAINPTNAMGATKRLAELYIQALQEELRSKGQGAGSREERSEGVRECGSNGESGQKAGRREEGARGRGQPAVAKAMAGSSSRLAIGEGDGRTQIRGQSSAPFAETADCKSTVSTESKLKLMAVRFGNVLGSSGSVIPTFRKQIAAGGPVTVTHPDVTRYFMTIPEAVGLVLQSATLGQGGEIFVLDMGKRVKIVDVARQLIELSGLRPDIDIEIKFTGLRPGEKLFEEINHDTEYMAPTDHPKIRRFVGEPLPFETIRQGLLCIHEKAASMDANQVKLEIQRFVPEYRPYLTTV